KEIILALNNTREGNFTSLYAQELFKQNELPNTRITRLGRGLATGSELEYADEDTLRNALLGRQ
ncbi:MAG: recombination protein RecR, partial [Candidatus Spechtbacterales bacterium]